MGKTLSLIAIVLTLTLIASAGAHAATYSLVDARYLPVHNINDPIEHKNRPIIQYSFEELDSFMRTPSFLRWNDGRKVCESMYLMFGRVSAQCSNLPQPKTFTRQKDVFVNPMLVPARKPVHREGKVTFTIEPGHYVIPRPMPYEAHAGSPLVIIHPVRPYPPMWTWT